MEMTGSWIQPEAGTCRGSTIRQLFAIGNVVEIKLGYVDDLETLMIGEITALEPEFVFNRLPSLTVRGYDRRHRLQRGRKTRTFVSRKTATSPRRLPAKRASDGASDDSEEMHDYVLQANQTDLDFLHERASRIQYDLSSRRQDAALPTRSPMPRRSLTLSHGRTTCWSFRPRLSSAGQVSEVMVRGWSPKDKKELIGRAKAGDEVSSIGGHESGAALVAGAFGTAIELAECASGDDASRSGSTGQGPL